MLQFINKRRDIDPKLESQIMDQGYGQIETYSFGERKTKVFLDPAQLQILYTSTSVAEASKFLETVV